VRRFLTSLICIFILAAPPAWAEGWEKLRTILATNFTRGQGLPHPVAMAIAQDAQGFVWIGTQGGLARFDGYRFHTYLHRDDDPVSLPGDVISGLATDTKGRLWVGTFTGEVGYYDSTIDGFRNFGEPAGIRPRGSVNALAADGVDGVWVASNTGLEHITGDGAITRYTHRDGDLASLPSDRIRTVLVGRDGAVWAATYRGLARLKPGGSSFEPIPLIGRAGGVVEDLVIGLEEASDGHLWFVTLQSQVGRIADDRPAALSLYDLSQTDQGGPSSYGLIEARPGELWIGRISGGITLLDIKSGDIKQIRHEATIPVSLIDDAVRVLFKGDNGLIWAGTNRGVSVIDPEIGAIENVMPSALPGRLYDANVLALAAAGQTAWLGLKDHGVARLDTERGLIAPLTDMASLPPGSVTALATEPDGSLWLAAGTGRALYRIRGAGGKASPIPFPRDDTSTLVALRWQDDALWVAAGPLMRLTPATGEWRVWRHEADPDSLADDSTTMMLPDGKGGMWVGTRRGLERLDLASGKFTHSVHDPADPHSLPGDFVASMLVDRRGRLWVSALGNGMAVAEPTEPGKPLRFRRIGTADGLPNPVVDALLEDDQGRIWASTDQGLAVIDPDTLAVRALGRDDGVAIPSYWTNSGAKLADGTLLFGGSEGLSVVHPDRLTHRPFTPSLVVTGIQIGARPVPPVVAKTGLTLGPRERSLEVEFAALDYSAPDKLRYAYRLEGFDDDWKTSDPARRLAAYTNLPPGDYHLNLRATDRDGTWLEPVSLMVAVEPAWWQTGWFRLLTGLFAAALVFGLVQLRTSYLMHRRRLLEELVASQTRDLTAANRLLQELASRDPLTEIYNRRHFQELASAELERARRSGRPASLLLIDIDHFKRVNDSFGHSAGDDVLKGVVASIRNLLRDSDLFARIGGEELVVLMPETGLDAARLVAERLRIAIGAASHPALDRSVTVTASIGLAVTASPPESLAELLDRADRALYAAKAAGRNRVAETA
jgi:diguanylate cyclase (GGDEF)-like protein